MTSRQVSEPKAAERQGRATLATVVKERLRHDLVSAVFKPGEKLAIDALCARYGAGASPVREALNRLSAEGWVEQFDQRGFCVPPVSEQHLEELTRTRCLLSEITLREAIARASEASDEVIVVALHRLSRTPSRLASDPDRVNPEWEQRHRAFHASLIAACQSQWLIDFDAMLFEQAARYRALSGRTGVHRDVASEHAAMAAAVLARNVSEAVKLVNDHILFTTRVVAAAQRDSRQNIDD